MSRGTRVTGLALVALLLANAVMVLRDLPQPLHMSNVMTAATAVVLVVLALLGLTVALWPSR